MQAQYVNIFVGIFSVIGWLLTIIPSSVAYYTTLTPGKKRLEAKEFATQVFIPSILGLVFLFLGMYFAFQDLTPLEFFPINIGFVGVALYISLSTLMFVNLRMHRATTDRSV